MADETEGFARHLADRLVAGELARDGLPPNVDIPDMGFHYVLHTTGHPFKVFLIVDRTLVGGIDRRWRGCRGGRLG